MEFSRNFETVRMKRWQQHETTVSHLLSLTKGSKDIMRFIRIMQRIFRWMDRMKELLSWQEPAQTFMAYALIMLVLWNSSLLLICIFPLAFLFVNTIRKSQQLSDKVEESEKLCVEEIIATAARISKILSKFCDMFESYRSYINAIYTSVIQSGFRGVLVGLILWVTWATFVHFMSIRHHLMMITTAIFLYDIPLNRQYDNDSDNYDQISSAEPLQLQEQQDQSVYLIEYQRYWPLIGWQHHMFPNEPGPWVLALPGLRRVETTIQPTAWEYQDGIFAVRRRFWVN